MWLRGFDFVVIEGGRRKEEPAGKPLGAGMSGGRKGGEGTSGGNRWAQEKEEGGGGKGGEGRNQRGSRWTWGRAEKGAHEQGASPGEGLPNGCV